MSKKFIYGQEIIDFLEEYGYNKRGEDFEQYKDYSTVTYMYSISNAMRPQTPYVEFTVDAETDGFIFGEYFTDGRKGYSVEFDSVEDLEYFVSNANYSHSDLAESKEIPTIEGDYKAGDGNDYYNIALNLENGDFVRIKNASCTAVAEEMACEYFGVPCNASTYKTIKIIFMGTSPNLDLNKIPKKYQKYFNKINESKKSSRKSLKESAKPINEKNVAKFVDEVNKWCDDNIHYVDMDAENFTKKYGKIYNFKYRKEDDFFVIYDSEGTLDLFDREASLVYPTLDKLAKNNGWYIDPYSCACDFTFGEL